MYPILFPGGLDTERAKRLAMWAISCPNLAVYVYAHYHAAIGLVEPEETYELAEDPEYNAFLERADLEYDEGRLDDDIN